MREFFQKYLKGDPIIWVIVFALSIFGVLAVYSSIGALAYQDSVGTEYYLIKHVALLIFGLGAMWLCHLIPISYFSRIAQVMYFLAIPALIYTMFYGVEINGARRWARVMGLTVQTSDFARVALICFVARFMHKRQGQVHDFQKTLLPILGAILLMCVLIFPEDFSTSATLFLTSMLLLFVSRIPLKQIGVLVGIGVFVLGGLGYYAWNTETDFGRIATMKSRVEAFFKDTDDGGSFQSRQAKIAVARGGLFGQGPGKSRQKNFLPSPFADFIYAIVIEEYGSVLGGLLLIFLYLLLMYRVFRILIRTKNSLAALMSIGLGFSLVVQALINMGVAVNVLPVTGLALPIVSRGGTSILFTSIAFGIILSASRTIYDTKNG